MSEISQYETMLEFLRVCHCLFVAKCLLVYVSREEGNEGSTLH